MNIHEYQAKKIFADYGIPVPLGLPAFTVAEAVQRAESLSNSAPWMIKAQLHSGGRGKAGGVQKVHSLQDLSNIAQKLLGSRLVTHQTGAQGQWVSGLLIEVPTAIDKEFYLSFLIDRSQQRIVIIASIAGGMDIEQVAAQSPDKIIQRTIDPIVGIQEYQCREIAFALQLNTDQRRQLSGILKALYRLFLENDLNLLEINPLVTTQSGQLLALDAKLTIDDNALYRHPELQSLYDATQQDEKEHNARQFDLNYIALDGNIACMVNGAGLAMATMDVIKLHGGEPANFLDVGGNTTADRVTEAFKIILSDPKVTAILINIFGGIVRCDLIAAGVIQAVKETATQLPVVVRLEGTNVEQGKNLLKESGLTLIPADNLDEAAQKAVQLSRH